MRASRRLALAAAFASLATAAPAAARPLDEVVESGVLRVALYRDNAPYSDDAGGEAVGIDVDIARAVAKEIGVKAEIRIVEAAENVDGDFRLNLWRGDLAGSQLADVMFHVPADKQLQFRNEFVAFTSPYVEQRIAIAYRSGLLEGGFQDFEDLKGRKVAVEGTSPADYLINFAGGGVYRDTAAHYRNFAEAAKAFVDGEADFLSGSRTAVEAALSAAKVGGVDIKDVAGTGPVKSRWELCAAVKSDSRDLGYRIGDAMTALAAGGGLKAIFAAHGASYVAPAGY